MIGNLTLQINGNGGNTCIYGTELNLGIIHVPTSIFSITGTFSPNNFYCSDNTGTGNSWFMTIQASSNLTGTYGQTIASWDIFMKTYPSTIDNGMCTASPGTTTRTSLINTQTVLWKTSATWQVCTITVTGVMLYISIPAYQAVGAYTGELTLSVPF